MTIFNKSHYDYFLHLITFSSEGACRFHDIFQGVYGTKKGEIRKNL
jgi:hypothetical protein